MSDWEWIDRQVGQLTTLIEGGPELLAARAERVSDWTVGQQLEHILLVGAAVPARLTDPDARVSRGINGIGRLLLALGWLPRGVGKAPAGVRPGDPTRESLRAALDGFRRALAALRADPALLAHRRPVFPHPYFGGLDPARTLRFLAVHTHHHLKIVRDIRRAARTPSP